MGGLMIRSSPDDMGRTGSPPSSTLCRAQALWSIICPPSFAYLI